MWLQYLTFNQMLINIFSFNIIWVFIECLPIILRFVTELICGFGLRAVLGQKGVALLSTVISLANFGWYAVAANLFANSMIHLKVTLGLSSIKGIWGSILGTMCVFRYFNLLGRDLKLLNGLIDSWLLLCYLLG